MAGRAKFETDRIETTLKRGENKTERVKLVLVGPDGADYHLEPGPKPTYDERWADPKPDGFRLGRNNKEEEIAIELKAPSDAKFGTHHFQLVAQNEDEPEDTATVDIAITVPFDWRPVLVILLIVLIVIVVFFIVRNT